MSLISSALGRFGLAGLLGMQFGGKRDLYGVFGYKVNLTYQDFKAKYDRQDIAKRIVNAPASATWRNPPMVKCDSNKDFVDKWNTIAEAEQIWSTIERADRLAGLGNYSILLLGFSDTSVLTTPVNKSADNKLLYIQPYTQLSATIKELDNDPRSERFGLPKIYSIRIGDLSDDAVGGVPPSATAPATVVSTTIEVHYTRIVHIAEELCESNYLGTPRLKAVYNLLDDLIKVSGGSAETYWLAGNKGMQVDVDKDAELNSDDAANLSAEVEEYQHELRRIIRTKGVKINNLGGTVPNPQPTFDVIISLISGTTGIPRRVLTGSEAGQLASDQDRANWSDRIKERRTTFAEPNVLNPLITALINAGVLPEVEEKDYDYEWPANFQLTPLEEAQTMAQRARAIINLAKHFQDGTPICSIEEARQIVSLPSKPAEGAIPPPPAKPVAKNKGQTDNQPNDF